MTFGWGSEHSLFTHVGRLTCTVVVTALVVFVACVCAWYNLAGGGWRGAVTVDGATYVPPNRLSLGVGSCLGGPKVTSLRESDVDVEIKVIAFTTPTRGGLSCRDGVGVRLEKPLGDRAVIDGHTGERVGVIRPIPFDAEVTRPAADWRLVKGPEWASRRPFSLQLPPGWELRVLEGLGPNPGKVVGEVVGDGAHLEFVFGGPSRNLRPDDGSSPDYGFGHEEIGGVRASLMVSMNAGTGYTGVSLHQRDGPYFHIVGEGLTREQQRTAVTVFRSIRLPLPDPEDIIDEDPPPPDAPPPFDDVIGITVPE